MSVKWEQWYQDKKLFVCGSTTAPNDGKGRLLIAVWDGDRWIDKTRTTVPEQLWPSDMEFIAMWSELPEPIEKLRNTRKARQKQ